MRLAEDRRARVPFALIAVLLLVSSVVFVTGLSTRDRPRVDRAIDQSLDRVDADARVAIRTAVEEAAQAASREPVTSRANTSVGQALDESQPFRDALRIRIYLRAHDRLSTTRYRHDDVTAEASLPPTPNVTALTTAKDRIAVEAVDNGTALAVTVRNVTLTATQTTETVATEQETYTVTVDSPVLALHDRAREFEARLNRGPVAGPGLGRQLTARLYPIAWARGGLQYGGLPIQNVVTNRHVALATNGGVLATQRAAFGRADPDASEGYTRARNRAMLHEIIAPTPLDAGKTTDAVLEAPVPPRKRAAPPDQQARSPDTNGLGRSSETGPGDALTVGVNRSADRALLAVHDTDPSIEKLIAEQYRATVQIDTRIERVRTPDPAAISPPGEEWTLAGVDTERSTRVQSPSNTPGDASVSLPPTTDGRVFQNDTRTVTEEISVERTWIRDGRTAQTTTERTRITRVGIAVSAEHDPPGRAPTAPVDPLFERGGVLDGSNLAAVETKAASIVDDRGGIDAVARRAATEGGAESTHAVSVEPPEPVEPWVRADLITLHRAIRNVSVAVERGTIGAGRANPPKRLAAELRKRRGGLIAAPARRGRSPTASERDSSVSGNGAYDGVADRARVAVRARYVAAVLADLEDRSDRHGQVNRRLQETIDQRGPDGAPDPTETIDSRSRATAPDRRAFHSRGQAGVPANRTLTVVPNGEPAYLTRSAVERGPVTEPSSPLATRNLNLFTVPYGDAVDVVVEEATGDRASDATDSGTGSTASLGTAGRTLIAANETLATHANSSLAKRRDALHREIRAERMDARRTARGVLERTAAVDAADAETAILAAEARFDGSGDGRVAVAIANGSYADAVAEKTALRTDLSEAERDVLTVRLRVELDTERKRGGVSAATVEETSRHVRTVATEMLTSKAKATAGNLTEQAAERALGDSYQGIPAGLPLLPIPGYWVATINVWHVQVRGTYTRFTLHARDGAPDRPGGTTYVRDGSPVLRDVDDDGTPEKLGRSDRISFETSTVVVIAVPPSGRGVGDVDGNADERSAGWPCPGPAGRDRPPCAESE